MNILVLGASGGVGRHIVNQAAARHRVAAVVRASTAFEAPASVTVLRGDVEAPGVLEQAIDTLGGVDVVLSSLGIKRRVPANPWSALVSSRDFCSTSARRIVDACTAKGVRRVIAVSAAGVGDSAAAMNALMRMFVATSNVGVAYRDLAVMEAVFAASGLDWLCPRPVRLTDGPLTGTAHVIHGFSMAAQIPRADVAAWMLLRAETNDAAALATRLPELAA